MTTQFRLVALLALITCLAGCSGEGLHLPRPDLFATNATFSAAPTASAPAAAVELLAKNGTDAPLWLRRLDITLNAQGVDIAAGIWNGDRLIDPGTSILLDIALPLIEGAKLPLANSDGNILVKTRYARSGVLGMLGGETFTYELPVVVRPAD